MSHWIIPILQVFGMAAVVLIVYQLLKRFVLNKVKVNKWIILAVAAIVFIVPAFFGFPAQGTLWNYIQSAVFVILLLWFLDLIGFGKRKDTNAETKYMIGNKKVSAKSNIVIKPKAKPNRVKNKKS